MSRRRWLGSALVWAVSLRCWPRLFAAEPATPSPLSDADAVALARWLTATADLDPTLARDACRALVAEDASQGPALSQLLRRIRAAQLADVEALRRLALAGEPQLMKPAIALIRALYTGRVGNGWRGRYVAYDQALMYRSTADVTVVPSFTRGGYGWWAEPPAAGIR